MDSGNLGLGDGQQPKRIIAADILFCGKGQFAQILHSPYIIRPDSHVLHFPSVKRHIMVYQPHCPSQPFPLQSQHFLPAHTFFRLIPNHSLPPVRFPCRISPQSLLPCIYHRTVSNPHTLLKMPAG